MSAKGFTILPYEPDFLDHWHFVNKMDEDVLLAPEVLVEQEETDLKCLLRPALDTLWQASGWPGE